MTDLMTVEVREPGALLQPLEEPEYIVTRGEGYSSEAGCTYEQYCQAIDYVRTRVIL